MLTVIAFIVALALLIAVHEYGHYRVAVACGVQVERFSIGFGKALLRWTPRKQRPNQNTEFVIAAFPFGGYVKMLDEREGPVPEKDRHLAFNNRPLRMRAAIVAAGPAANLLLAVLLYACVNWYGVQEPKAILASPLPESMAAEAGLRGGESVQRAALDGDELDPIRSFEELRWLLMRGALDGRDVRIEYARGHTGGTAELVLPLSTVDASEADARLYRRIGVLGPWTQPVIGEVFAGGAAEKSGLKAGDLIYQVGAVPVIDGAQLRELIRTSVKADKGTTQVWKLDRNGRAQSIEVTPDAHDDKGTIVGRISAYVGATPEMVDVQYGPIDGLWRGVVRTWEVSVLTLRMMGKMLIGEASLRNLSGPLTIADYAGKSAQMGLTSYLLFLALISVSLGVLNLLPLPVLDGGHLMYYLWEGLTGRVVSDVWMERMQRGGVALLMVMMVIAVFNDVTRIFG
jgi:regulator of sigma E protease